MKDVNGLHTDNQPEREEAFAQLELLRKEGTITDDDAELASYRNEKYGKLYLNSIPEMAKSIVEGAREPLEDCVSEDMVEW